MAAALMMATMMAGCSQDEGNYDYHSLNEPKIGRASCRERVCLYV